MQTLYSSQLSNARSAPYIPTDKSGGFTAQMVNRCSHNGTALLTPQNHSLSSVPKSLSILSTKICCYPQHAKSLGQRYNHHARVFGRQPEILSRYRRIIHAYLILRPHWCDSPVSAPKHHRCTALLVSQILSSQGSLINPACTNFSAQSISSTVSNENAWFTRVSYPINWPN